MCGIAPGIDWVFFGRDCGCGGKFGRTGDIFLVAIGALMVLASVVLVGLGFTFVAAAMVAVSFKACSRASGW